MIYITGDTHGDFSKFELNNFPQQKEMTKDDYVIICGDFGGVWSYEKESQDEKRVLDYLESKNFTTLFVDGNHENFDRLLDYPEEKWHGGKIHRIRPSVIHLMRGEIFDIEDKKIFAFGGASSHDIQDGIVDMEDTEKIYHMRKIGATFRIKNYTWWELELPTKEEMENGIKNLEKVNFKVDYIITHCIASNIQMLINSRYKKDVLTNYFQEILAKTEFNKWYCGHYHEDR